MSALRTRCAHGPGSGHEHERCLDPSQRPSHRRCPRHPPPAATANRSTECPAPHNIARRCRRPRRHDNARAQRSLSRSRRGASTGLGTAIRDARKSEVRRRVEMRMEGSGAVGRETLSVPDSFAGAGPCHFDGAAKKRLCRQPSLFRFVVFSSRCLSSRQGSAGRSKPCRLLGAPMPRKSSSRREHARPTPETPHPGPPTASAGVDPGCREQQP